MENPKTNGATIVARSVISGIPVHNFHDHSMDTGIQSQNAPDPKKVMRDPILNPGNAGVSQPQYGYRDPVAKRPPPKESYDRPYNPGNAGSPVPQNN